METSKKRGEKLEAKERRGEGGGMMIEAEWKRLDWKRFAGWMSGVTMIENLCTYPLLLVKTRQQVHPSLLSSSPSLSSPSSPSSSSSSSSLSSPSSLSSSSPSSSPSPSPSSSSSSAGSVEGIAKKRMRGTSMIETMKGIIRREGVRGMYRGFWTYSLIPIPKCTYFLTYHWMKDFLLFHSTTTITNHQMISKAMIITTPLIAGITAELVANVFFVPIELIVQRIQITCPMKHESGLAMEMVKGIWREEGVRGYYRGYGATMITFGISSGVYWMAYEYSKSFLSSLPSFSPSPYPFLPKLNPSSTFLHHHHHSDDDLNNYDNDDNNNNREGIKGKEEGRKRGVQFIAGFIAGVTSSIFSNPFDVVKTRLQTQIQIHPQPHPPPHPPPLSPTQIHPQPHPQSLPSAPPSTSYRNTMEGMKVVYRTEGMRGFTRGLFAKSMRAGPFAAAYSLLYEQVLSWSIIKPSY